LTEIATAYDVVAAAAAADGHATAADTTHINMTDKTSQAARQEGRQAAGKRREREGEQRVCSKPAVCEAASEPLLQKLKYNPRHYTACSVAARLPLSAEGSQPMIGRYTHTKRSKGSVSSLGSADFRVYNACMHI
jgi:hypothetical protein